MHLATAPVGGSAHFLLGPGVALLAVGLLSLVLRWVFSTKDRDARARRAAERGDYGLLVPVATARTPDDAAMLRDVLRGGGVRASISPDLEVLVFAKDADQARRLVGT